MSFHSLLAAFQVSISLISFLKSLFWMKLIQGSVRVKVKENVHAWPEFLFVSIHAIFKFFPQVNHFYYFTSLHGLQDVENHCAHLVSSWRLVEKLHISTFPMYYSLYNWIREHEITKLKKKYLNQMNCIGSSEYTTVCTSFTRASFLNMRADQ